MEESTYNEIILIPYKYCKFCRYGNLNTHMSNEHICKSCDIRGDHTTRFCSGNKCTTCKRLSHSKKDQCKRCYKNKLIHDSFPSLDESMNMNLNINII